MAVLLLLSALPEPVLAQSLQSGAPQALFAAASQHKQKAIFDALPQDFESNRGQTDPRVRYISRGIGYTLFLTQSEAVLSLNSSAPNPHAAPKTSTLSMQFMGANRRATLLARDPRRAKSNYLLGSNSANWRTDIPHFGRVEYEDLYPGVNLIYYGNQQQLEYDLVVAPGADLTQIRIKFQGVRRISVERNGDLALEMPGGVVRKRKPIAYQDAGGRRQSIEAQYVLRGGNEVSFRLGPYDSQQPLVIDPVLVYSTYFGGTGIEIGFGITLDAAGNTYAGWYTTSVNFPTVNPFQASLAGNRDAFVVKMDPNGTLLYATYLGGSGEDTGADIAVDAEGNAYLTGKTLSANFPTLNPIQPALSGSTDAFITKINASGNALVYSTYFGGGAVEYGFAIAVDAGGNASVCGYTTSSNFPTLNAFQPAKAANTDGFVLRLNASGSALIYSTYLGGSGNDVANHMTVDAAGNAYVVGDTTSTNFPRLSALQQNYAGGTDGFLTHIDPNGALVYSTYLGGSASDAIRDAKVDASGNVYITGGTVSLDFPTVNPLQANNAGGVDVFVAEVNSTGSALIFSTYLGGSDDDKPIDLALDAAGCVYVVGFTLSANFPTVNPLQAAYAGNRDAFVAKINPWGNVLLFSTYLGGSNLDQGNSIAVDGDGNAYVTGQTQSSNFPVVHAHQPVFGGNSDAFVAKIATCAFSIAPPDSLFDSTGATGDILVSTTAECPWTALSHADWLTITYGNSGVGNGNVSYSVAPNATATTLTGTITAGGKTFTVTQAPGGVTLSSVSPATGNAGTNVDVTLSGTNFASDAVLYAGLDITVSNVVIVSPSEISATFSIATTAAQGPAPVTVTTSGGTSNAQPFTVIPQPIPEVVLTYPNGGEKLFITSPSTISWTAQDPDGAISFFDVFYSTNGGGVFAPVPGCSGVAGAARSCLWASPGPVTSAGRIRVTAHGFGGNTVSDLSNANYSVVSGAGSITVTQPNSALTWLIGTPQQIKWNHNLGLESYVNIELSRDVGASWELLAASFKNTGATSSVFNWTVTGAATTQARIRVSWLNGPASDISNVNFTIASPSVTVTQPNTNLNWAIGTSQQFKWNHNVGLASTFTIELSRDGGGTYPEVVTAAAPASTATTGVYNWTVTGPPTALARIRVTFNANPLAADSSNVNFIIADPFLSVATPSSTTANWGFGSQQTVNWTTNLGASDRVNVLMSTDGGATFPIVLASNLVASTKTVKVTTPTLGAPTTLARVRVEWVADPSVAGSNPVNFKVQPPFVSVTSPNGPANAWTIGTSKSITWTHNLGSLESVLIELSLDGGASYTVVLFASTPCDGSQSVTVQSAWATSQARVRISWLKDGLVTDVSNQDFPIQ